MNNPSKQSSLENPVYHDDHQPEEVGPQRMIYRLAKVEGPNDCGLWPVRSMYDRGMMFDVGLYVRPNEKLLISLSDTICLWGRVVWSGDGRCGVAFDRPIRHGEVMGQLIAEQESERYRPLRLTVSCLGQLLTEEQWLKVEVVSLSQNGAEIAVTGALKVGAGVDLALRDGLRRSGIIRWTRNGEAGVQLKSPFAISDLESVRYFGCRLAGRSQPTD
ncbi:PilZ domain-containing protein [Sphingosinicella soli]|uniref:PilZ domain-containing protein n=1 Tax=Sphingosinicella soli TaxID=333708 RepID=A0A7W7B6G9_9SPHN|nr:PilZ domain-containing protein [Sphingosinicella soli]MBB4633915.1 hypothetical protein [Sphingosinicella soli]